MNKRNNNVYLSVISDIVDKYKDTKTIYIVKYDEVHSCGSTTRRSTYNIMTFDNFVEAEECMDLIHQSVIDYLTNEGYIMLLDEVNKDNDKFILRQKNTKLMKTNNKNCTAQIKNYKFFIEEIYLQN